MIRRCALVLALLFVLPLTVPQQASAQLLPPLFPPAPVQQPPEQQAPSQQPPLQQAPGQQGPLQLPSAAQPVQPAINTDLQITWEVRNRFRLFREERDFLLQTEAMRGHNILTAEQTLEIQSDGRG
jgi:hypothetical protein